MIRDGDWIYLEVEDILHIARREGLGSVLSISLLQSACGRPRSGFGGVEMYTDAASKAAALGWGLARNHGLVDGNKRLGAYATLTFLLINGYDVAVTQGELVSLFLQTARGLLEQEELCLFLRSRATLAPRGGVHRPRPTQPAAPDTAGEAEST